MNLVDLLPESQRVLELRSIAPDRVVAELVELIAPEAGLQASQVDQITRQIITREREATTGIGNRVAVPHLKSCAQVDRIHAAFGRSREGIDWSSIDGVPVNLFFLLLTPEGRESEHVQVMRRIVHIGRDPTSVAYLSDRDDPANFGAILAEADDAVGS